jgi:hypothetical protein
MQMNDEVKDLVSALAVAFDEIGDAMEASSVRYFLAPAVRAAKNEASKSSLRLSHQALVSPSKDYAGFCRQARP